MDLTQVSIVIPGDCYQRLITHLTNHFTYAQIFQVIADLEKNAFQIVNEVVAPYDPKFQNENKAMEFPLVNGLEEAQKADQQEMHQGEPIVTDE